MLFNTFHRAGLSSHLEVDSGWGQSCSRTHPVDILVTNWDNGISAASMSLISRNGPYIGGHLAFYFKLNFKQVYNVL